uniref:Uncharacterized protein n=1 Tax=Pararge aegeria TaxID=116150 RepID=S4P8C7_9NEOP
MLILHIFKLYQLAHGQQRPPQRLLPAQSIATSCFRHTSYSLVKKVVQTEHEAYGCCSLQKRISAGPWALSAPTLTALLQLQIGLLI